MSLQNFSAKLNPNESLHLENDSNYACPLNQFCSFEARFLCRDIPLRDCQSCDVSILFGITAIYVLLGIAIFVGNGLIISVYVYRYYMENVTKSDAIRLSLAVADTISGRITFKI